MFSRIRNKSLTLLFTIFTIIVLGLSSCGYGSTLKFVQFSDAHITATRKDTSYKLLANSYDLLVDAVAQTNALKDLDFVILTGDAVDIPEENALIDFIRIMNKLNAPWYTALGNHDISISGKLTKDRYVKLMNSYNKSYNFAKPYYSFTPKKGFKVVVLDGVITSSLTANGYITQDQLTFLDKQLKSSKKDTVLIFMHYPLLEPFSSKSHTLKNADEVYKVLDKYKQPIGIFTGHYHSTKITKDNNIVHVSTPSLVTYPNSFRYVNVTNYSNRVVFDFYFNETSLNELQEKAQTRALSSQLYKGAETDRTTSVIIKK